MVGINLQTMSLDFFNQNYRFAFTDKSDTLTLAQAVNEPTVSQADTYRSMTLDQFNSALSDLETNQNQTAVNLDVNSQPKEVRELFAKIAGGKYGTFVKHNLDGFVMGRNFQKVDPLGDYGENLGTTVGQEVSASLDASAPERLGMVDTYNTQFNSVAQKTAGDKAFTKFANILSLFGNEVKDAYYKSKGVVKDDEGSYQFLSDAFGSLQDYMSKSGSLNFVKNNEKSVFNTAVKLMKDNLDAEIKKLDPASKRVTFNFSGIA